MNGSITITADKDTGVTVEMTLNNPGYFEKDSIKSLVKYLLDFEMKEANA